MKNNLSDHLEWLQISDSSLARDSGFQSAPQIFKENIAQQRRKEGNERPVYGLDSGFYHNDSNSLRLENVLLFPKPVKRNL